MVLYKKFIIRYPIFSFLSYLFESFFEFQQGVTERLFFNETFDLWSHGKEIDL